jgi:hypothetical protein
VSLSKGQIKVIDKKLIDLNSFNASDFKEFKGDALITTLYNIAVEFLNSAESNLKAKDRVASGALLDSIKPTEVQIFGQVYTLNINANDYYKFIDRGVKGWQSGNPSDSPYAFKKSDGKGSHGTNSQMVTAIRKWLIKEGLKSKNISKNPKHSISARESRRQKITDTSTSAAIVISGQIRKNGLKKTNFWSDAEKSTMDYDNKNLSIALEIDILNSL